MNVMFVEKRGEVNIMDIQKLLYLLDYTEYSINELVYKVLNDSETDPHYSAVTSANLIKSYIQIMKDLNRTLPYNDVKGYMLDQLYTEEEYDKFEEKRQRESTYYIGQQF